MLRCRAGTSRPLHLGGGYVECHLSAGWGSGNVANLFPRPPPDMQPTFKFALATAVLATAVTGAVDAQSSSGNIAGEAVAGDTITVTGVDTGFRREVRIEKDGKFQIRRVPTGEYQVVRVHKDGAIDPAQGVVVRPGGTARVMEAGKAAAGDATPGT